METVSLEKEIGGFIGRLLRDHFGRGPGSVNCVVAEAIITVNITNFLSPMEKSLLDRQHAVYVQKTRDLLMEKLIVEINSFIESNLGNSVQEFYYDWNLDKQSGAFLIFMQPFTPSTLARPYRNKELVHKTMEAVSILVQKEPESIYSEKLFPRTLLVARRGILVPIEKELIQYNFDETLQIAKRSLEKRALELHSVQIEALLGTKMTDVYVDWDYQKDIGYTLFFFE